MNATTIAEKKDNNTEALEINLPEEKKSRKEHSLLIMTAISLLVMFVAVGLIYYFIKTDPTIIHENDQTMCIFVRGLLRNAGHKIYS